MYVSKEVEDKVERLSELEHRTKNDQIDFMCDRRIEELEKAEQEM